MLDSLVRVSRRVGWKADKLDGVRRRAMYALIPKEQETRFNSPGQDSNLQTDSTTTAAAQQALGELRPSLLAVARNQKTSTSETLRASDQYGDVVRLVANKSPGQRLSLNRSQ